MEKRESRFTKSRGGNDPECREVPGSIVKEKEII